MGEFNIAQYEVIDGALHKLCKGVSHREGAFVSIDNYYVIKSGRSKGQLYHICKECVRLREGAEPRVYLNQAWHNFVMELINRLGFAETARRLDRSDTWLREFRDKKKSYMLRETARRIITVLRDVRSANEVRHRNSIKSGAYIRGRPEKTPTARDHFYDTRSDHETGTRRAYREREGR